MPEITKTEAILSIGPETPSPIFNASGKIKIRLKVFSIFETGFPK